MATGIIYFVVILLSTLVGSLSGMGGGVIIKPVLDAIPIHSLPEIVFYSSAAVLTMSVSSTIRQVRNKVQINWRRAAFLSAGSVMGGILGDVLLRALFAFYPHEENVKFIQNVLMIISLSLALVYMLTGRKKQFALRGWWLYLSMGLFLGAFSTLLGIGGGPLNVALLILLFGMHVKQATTYSIIIIFFSQLSRMVSLGAATGFSGYDLTILAFLIPAALLGGWLGGIISGRLSDRRVAVIYNIVVIGVIALNVWSIADIVAQGLLQF